MTVKMNKATIHNITDFVTFLLLVKITSYWEKCLGITLCNLIFAHGPVKAFSMHTNFSFTCIHFHFCILHFH